MPSAGRDRPTRRRRGRGAGSRRRSRRRNIVHGVTASVRLIPNSSANATESAGNVYRPPYAIAPTTNAPTSGSETRVARRAIGRAIAAIVGGADLARRDPATGPRCDRHGGPARRAAGTSVRWLSSRDARTDPVRGTQRLTAAEHNRGRHDRGRAGRRLGRARLVVRRDAAAPPGDDLHRRERLPRHPRLPAEGYPRDRRATFAHGVFDDAPGVITEPPTCPIPWDSRSGSTGHPSG